MTKPMRFDDDNRVYRSEPKPAFLLNVNDGQDVIHDPTRLTERCNTDDIEGRQRVDARTATEMIAKGQAVICRHCGYQTKEEVHL